MKPIKQVKDYLKEQLNTIDDKKLIAKLKRKTIHDGSVETLTELKDKMFTDFSGTYYTYR